MHAEDPLKLEALLTEAFGRPVSLWWEGASSLKIVISSAEAYNRVEILADCSGGDTWLLSDSGLTADLLESGLDFVIDKLEDAEPELTRRGREILATVAEVDLVEGITSYVGNLEFMPVLDGLWANNDSEDADAGEFDDANMFGDIDDYIDA